MSSLDKGQADTARHAPAGGSGPDRPPDEAVLLVRSRDGDDDAFARARRPVSSARVLVPEPLRCRSVRPRRPLSGGLSECAHRCTPFRRQPAGAPLALHDCRELHPQLFPEAASSPARVRRTEANVGRPGATGTTPDGERSAVASQTLAWLERQIPQLPLRQREVLLLACVERRPQQEIAQILGMPLNTIKTHLRRARLSLAHKLAQARAEGSERHS